MVRTPNEIFADKVEDIQVAADKQRTLARQQFEVAIEAIKTREKIDIATARAELHATRAVLALRVPR